MSNQLNRIVTDYVDHLATALTDGDATTFKAGLTGFPTDQPAAVRALLHLAANQAAALRLSEELS